MHYIDYQQANGDLIDIDIFCSAICREDYAHQYLEQSKIIDDDAEDQSGYRFVNEVMRETDYCEWCANPKCMDFIHHGNECECNLDYCEVCGGNFPGSQLNQYKECRDCADLIDGNFIE